MAEHTNDKADHGKIFDTVLTTIKETRTAFFANFLSGFALMLTALGLILTYDKIQPILVEEWIYYFSILVLLMFAVLYTRYLLSIRDKVKTLINLLNELGYMDSQYYAHYELKRVEFLPMVMAILVMFFVMILVLSWIKYWAPLPPA